MIFTNIYYLCCIIINTCMRYENVYHAANGLKNKTANQIKIHKPTCSAHKYGM